MHGPCSKILGAPCPPQRSTPLIRNTEKLSNSAIKYRNFCSVFSEVGHVEPRMSTT